VRSLFALAILLPVAAIAPAWASGAAKSPAHGGAEAAKHEGRGEREIGAPRTPNIDMPGLVSPVVVEGELRRYVYLSLNLQLHDIGQRSMMLEKIPYLQDAFLREVHGASIANSADPSTIDEAGLIKRLLRVCDAVVGPGIVKNVEILKAAPTGF
jgi:hypothetical protein